MKNSISNTTYKEIHKMLKERKIHPRGEFDKQGRFYLDDSDLVDVRSPSVSYPYSQMLAGRTLKFVKAVANKYDCKNKDEILINFTQ